MKTLAYRFKTISYCFRTTVRAPSTSATGPRGHKARLTRGEGMTCMGFKDVQNKFP